LIPEQLKRALSIRQPWVELIMRKEKTEEYRSGLTHIRERVYLYAGETLAVVPDFPEAETMLLPCGVIVGSVEIIGCHENEDGCLRVCRSRDFGIRRSEPGLRFFANVEP
jgi:hypothetical protein